MSIDDLQQLYRRALSEQIIELEAARASAIAGDDAAAAAIRRAVHSLRGSGGTYGFPEITAAAEAVERDGSPAGPSLGALIAVLRSVAEPPPRTDGA